MSLTRFDDHPQISRFCWQNLQVDPAPDFPAAELLREEAVQETIYKRVFCEEVPLRPPRRYQARVLKQLISRIEAAIEDWDLHVSRDVTPVIYYSLLPWQGAYTRDANILLHRASLITSPPHSRACFRNRCPRRPKLRNRGNT